MRGFLRQAKTCKIDLTSGTRFKRSISIPRLYLSITVSPHPTALCEVVKAKNILLDDSPACCTVLFHFWGVSVQRQDSYLFPYLSFL
jgi:hypothetical protein